jgi:hypothetical protein
MLEYFSCILISIALEDAMDPIEDYSRQLDPSLRKICEELRKVIDSGLPHSASRLYHGAPVWFIDENPIVGYSLKRGKIALLFWSGQSFKESGLSPVGKHKAAEISFGDSAEVDDDRLAKWLAESERVMWDYKSIIKKKGKLELLKGAEEGDGA